MFITDWVRFMRISFAYMGYCKFGIQRYDWLTAKNADADYINSKYNVFPFGIKENYL